MCGGSANSGGSGGSNTNDFINNTPDYVNVLRNESGSYREATNRKTGEKVTYRKSGNGYKVDTTTFEKHSDGERTVNMLTHRETTVNTKTEAEKILRDKLSRW